MEKVKQIVTNYSENNFYQTHILIQTKYHDEQVTTGGKGSINDSMHYKPEQLTSNKVADYDRDYKKDKPIISISPGGEYVEDIKITARDIILTPYNPGNTQFEGAATFQDNVNSQNLDDEKARNKNHGKEFSHLCVTCIALIAYLSTPKFIKKLTDISDELITTPNRMEYL